MIVDSAKQQLDIGQIIPIWLMNNPQDQPANVVMPAIINELSLPDVKTILIGNTLFELIHKEGDAAFFKAFNVDTAENFMQSSTQFVHYVKNEMGITTLVTDYTDPAISQMLKVLAKRTPPGDNVGFKIMKTEPEGYRAIINIGGLNDRSS